MDAFHIEDKIHHVKDHFKASWAEDVILAIIFVALLCLVLSSAVSYG